MEVAWTVPVPFTDGFDAGVAVVPETVVVVFVGGRVY